MKTSYTLRILVFIGALIQLVSPLFLTFDEQAVNDPMITPADYTFAVWGLISLASFVFAVYQLLPGQRQRALFDRIAVPLIGVYITFVAWLYAAGMEWTWATVAIFVAMFLLLLVVSGKIRHEALTKFEEIFVGGTFAVYLGWATVAIFANLAVALEKSGFIFADERSIAVYIALLIAAFLNSFWVRRWLHNNIYFVLTVVWAFAGIIIGAHQDGSVVVPAIASMAIILTLLPLAFETRSR